MTRARSLCCALLALTLGCAASPVRRTPPATPVLRAEDRPVELRFPRYGPLVVKFGDGTLGSLAHWSNGRMTTKWRSDFRVRDYQMHTNLVCLLTEHGEAGCQSTDEHPGPFKPALFDSEALTVAIGPGYETCVTLRSGATRCTRNTQRLENQGFAERLFNGFGKLKKIISLTACGFDFDDRLVCSAGGAHESEPKVILEGVLDASLVPGGGFSVKGCVLMKDHTVKCFGSNTEGELGLGRRSQPAAPTTVPGLKDVVKVSSAHGKACAVRSDGAVFCWGARFGPDGLTAASVIPRCKTKTRTIELEPCPETGGDGDNPCERARYNASREGVDLATVVDVTHDAAGQCIAPGESPYAPWPTRIWLVPAASDVVAADRHAMFLRTDGVVVTVGESFEYDENAVSPTPDDPRLISR